MKFFKRAFVAVVCAAVSATAAQAADPPEWEAALQARSARLVLFSLLKDKPRDSEKVQLSFARSLGLLHDSKDGLEFQRPKLSVTPILEYDQNVNGGIPGETFFLGPYEFTVDEDARAKSAYVIGASLAATASMFYERGSSLDFTLGTTLRHAPAVDVTRQSTYASVCLNHYVGSWTWFTSCSGYRYDDARDLDDTEESTFNSAGVRKVFSSAWGSHEGTVNVINNRASDYDKIVLQLKLANALPGIGGVNLGMTLGQHVPDENTLKHSFNASLRRDVFGRDTGFSLTYYKNGGQQFFGQAREDRVTRIGIDRELNKFITVAVSAQQRRSTIDIYDEERINLDFSFRPWRF